MEPEIFPTPEQPLTFMLYKISNKKIIVLWNMNSIPFKFRESSIRHCLLEYQKLVVRGFSSNDLRKAVNTLRSCIVCIIANALNCENTLKSCAEYLPRTLQKCIFDKLFLSSYIEKVQLKKMSFLDLYILEWYSGSKNKLW